MRLPRPRGPLPPKSPARRRPRLPLLGAIASALAASGGCDEAPTVRVYDAPADAVPATATTLPAAGPAATAGGLAWDVPEGYRDTGESNRFRTATLADASGEVEVAISRVPGQAGSIEANVNRWRDQLGLPAAGRAEVIEAVSSAPTGEGGLPGMVVTLANPAATPPAAQRIAWFDLGQATWYVKASGPPESIERETPALDRFLASLRADPDAPATPAAAPPPAPDAASAS